MWAPKQTLTAQQVLCEAFQVSGGVVCHSMGLVASALGSRTSEEHCCNLLPFLCLPWECPRVSLYLAVRGIGLEDGAQEVVKDILEDVVASAVKGKRRG